MGGEMRQIVWVNGECFMFYYRAGREEDVFNAMIAAAEDPECVFDWHAAEFLAARVYGPSPEILRPATFCYPQIYEGGGS